MPKNIIKFISLLIILLVFFISLPLLVSSQTNPSDNFDDPLKYKTFTELFMALANWAAGIAGSLAVIFIIVGGFQYIFSGGSEEKTKAANKTIFWALIGLLIIVSSWSILKVIYQILGDDSIK